MVQFKDIAREYRATYRGNMVGVPIVGLEHIEPYDMLLKKWDTDVETTFTKTFKKGQILFGRRRAYQHKACVATCDGICSGDITVIEPIEGKIYPDLLPFIIQNDNFFEHAIKGSNGALSPRVKWEHMANYEFSLPSLAEQKILADKLWAAYEVKQSYLNMIDATNQMVKAKFVKMFGDPVKNDKNWDVLPVEKVAPESPSLHGKSGNVWVLNLDMVESQTGKVLGKVYTDSSELNSVNAIDKGNVLLSKLRPYLNKVVLPDDDGYATTELVPLRPNQDKLNLVFFCCLLRGDSFVFFANKIATGLKMPRLPMDVLRSFKVILPPMEMQNEFASIYTQAEQSIAHLNASVEAIDKVIRSLINENL